MNPTLKKILIAAGVVLGAWAIWAIIKAIGDAREKAMSFTAAFLHALSAPYRAIAETADAVGAAASLPALHSQSVQLDGELGALNNSDYAPGGKIYNRILVERGRAAADAAWAAVQRNLVTQQADTASWWKIW